MKIVIRNNHINKREDETQILAYHFYFIFIFHLFIFIEQWGSVVALRGKESYIRQAANLLLFIKRNADKKRKWKYED